MPLDNPFGYAAADLGFGPGDALRGQVADDTEELRKKRMAQLSERQMLGPAGSLAVTSLFGSRGGMPGGNY